MIQLTMAEAQEIRQLLMQIERNSGRYLYGAGLNSALGILERALGLPRVHRTQEEAFAEDAHASLTTPVSGLARKSEKSLSADPGEA